MAITEVLHKENVLSHKNERNSPRKKLRVHDFEKKNKNKIILVSCVFMTGTADNARSPRALHILHMWNINSRHSYAMYAISLRTRAYSGNVTQVQVTQESALWTVRVYM